MKLLFINGWQSVPGGVKPTFLAQHDHEVINPKLPDEDFGQDTMSDLRTGLLLHQGEWPGIEVFAILQVVFSEVALLLETALLQHLR